MSTMQKQIASRLIHASSPLTNLDSNILIYILIAFLSRLESRRGADFLGLLSDAVVYRCQLGQWPSPDDEYGFNCSQHRISPSGVRFTLYRQEKGNYKYWYLSKYLPNGKKFNKYVGRNIVEAKLCVLYAEYDRVCAQILAQNE